MDCGLDGAVSALNVIGGILDAVESWHVPIVTKEGKKEYDLDSMRGLLWNARGFLVIERQQAFPGQGVVSTFKTGRGYGLWEGVAVGLGIDYVTVRPRVWQTEMIPGKAGETKQRSIAKAHELFPDVSLRISPRHRVDHHGKSDSLLIAEWGRRNYKFIQATKQGGIDE